MLLKIKELGGNISLMDLEYYQRSLPDAEKVLNIALDNEFKFLIKNSKSDEEYNKIWNNKEKRALELRKLLIEQNLNLEEINKKNSILMECESYDLMQVFTTLPRFEKDVDAHFCDNYPINKDIIDTMMDMPLYTSFNEYYTKVLKR